MSVYINDDSNDEESYSESSEASFEEREGEGSGQVVRFSDLADSDGSSVEEESDVVDVTEPEIDIMHFLDEWEQLPRLTEITIEESKRSMISENIKLSEEESVDEGQFVDPLTGISIASPTPSIGIEQMKPTEVEVEEVTDDEASESAELEDIILPDALDESFAVKPPAEEDLEVFLEMETVKPLITEEEIDGEAVARAEEVQRIQQMTTEFVYDIINEAVDISEFISPEIILRQNLNKRFLMLEISRKFSELDYERKINQFLNRKAVEYHRRKKINRALMAENQKSAPNEKAKYIQILLHLDSVLEIHKELQLKSVIKKKYLEVKYQAIKESAYAEVHKFETMFRKQFVHDSWPRLNAIINSELDKMAKVREEINGIRFQLLMIQHTNALLTNKLSQIENLGNGLSMKDFSNLQTQTQNLGKKVEERNNELNKLHMRCRSDIHTMAHYKEKQRMLRNTIVIQKAHLEELLQEKHKLRERIFRMKLQRQRARKDIKETSFQGGLLDNLTLMYDYDWTIDLLQKKRNIVSRLRSKMEKMIDKINEVGRRCPF